MPDERTNNWKIPRKEEDLWISSTCVRTHYAYECKLPFGWLRAGVYLSRARERTWHGIIADSAGREHTYLYTHAFAIRDVSDLPIPSTASSASAANPFVPLPRSRLSLPSRSNFQRPRRPCTLPRLSATVISQPRTFVRAYRAPPGFLGTCCCRLYFSINYTTVRDVL